MKTLKPILLLAIGVLLTMTSCRTEDDLAIDPPVEETIEANSTIANLMSRTASNDGSPDNIIDNASCLSVQLPVTVTVNGIELEINDDDGYEDIEDIIDLFDDDVDSVVISYPITVILVDFSTVVVNSDLELGTLTANCVGENEDDDDIECIDFQYPITASVFDENNDLINSITINNDNDMYDFIDDLDDFAAVTINFPIKVIFADGSSQTINSIPELENAIEIADDSCDEDDDNDFDDDDCDNCTTNDLETVFADCTEWTVDKLERNDNDLEDNYVGYVFEFNSDGTILVTQGSNTFNGTWGASGTGNNISVTINVTGTLPDGQKVSDNAMFRIKDLPKPTGTVRGEDGALDMQRNSLEISTIGAKFDDFDFELPLRVTGFKFKVPGQPTIQVNGNKLDARAKQALKKAKRGSGVQIFDIEAKAQGVSVILKKVSPVFIELTN